MAARRRTRKARIGRPPKPKIEKYSRHILVHMTQKERKILEEEAKERSISLSAILMLPWRMKRRN